MHTLQRISLRFCLLLFFSSSFAFASQLELLTFNTGLAYTFVPLAKERLPLITKKLKEETADLICLQEVWEKKDRDLISKELKNQYPYSYSVKGKQRYTTSSPACYPSDLVGKNKFGNCLSQNCIKSKGDDFTQCVIKTCGPSLNELKENRPQCAAALISQVGRSVIASLLNVLNPFGKVGLFTYKGNDGLLLLSKHPFIDKNYIEMSDISTSLHRGALVAKISPFSNKLPIQVLCTHLTANLNDVAPYTGSLAGWEQEQAKQLERLVSIAKGTSPLPTVLIGDMNCSLSDPSHGIRGEYENNCQIPLPHNTIDASGNLSNPQCSYCDQNPLLTSSSKQSKAQENGMPTGILIDHIYLFDFQPFIKGHSSQVLYQDLIKVENTLVPLSDHYAIKMNIVF